VPDSHIARRTDSHFADSISVRRSPRWIVNLLLISCRQRLTDWLVLRMDVLQFPSRTTSAHPVFRTCGCSCPFRYYRKRRSRRHSRTHSCFSVCTSSFIFCSRPSISRRMPSVISFKEIESLFARTDSSARSSDNAARNRYAPWDQLSTSLEAASTAQVHLCFPSHNSLRNQLTFSMSSLSNIRFKAIVFR